MNPGSGVHLFCISPYFVHVFSFCILLGCVKVLLKAINVTKLDYNVDAEWNMNILVINLNV